MRDWDKRQIKVKQLIHPRSSVQRVFLLFGAARVNFVEAKYLRRIQRAAAIKSRIAFERWE